MWVKNYYGFVWSCLVASFRGNARYYAWMTLLTVITLVGLNAYAKQLVYGLHVTGMSDHVSWGVYIANFTYLVGIAAAAAMLVIPAYVYRDSDMRDVAIFGELLAVAAIVMCLLFVVVDMGRPDRLWHVMPLIGRLNWPQSMLSWDVIVLGVYLLINMHVCGYVLYSRYQGREPSRWLYLPFIFVSIGWAISIHTVTAFLYVGLGGRPFWNSAILGPRFIASAFAAGPAFIVLTFQLIRRFSGYKISDSVLFTLRRIIQVTMLINMFLLGCEVFKEFYTDSLHVASARYLYFGLHGHEGLVPWIWAAVAMNTVSTLLLVSHRSRQIVYLNLACVLAIVGIWIEKGMGLIVPAFVPTPLGQVIEYTPSVNETLVCVGIWAFGFLLYTLMLKSAVPILTGERTSDRNGV
ncbi:MAG: polysulfide reductase NrfD [Proteobacteria bacterium]|nr:polysulfide reductase NrfD [Pseudomonadota bacterium]